MLKIPMTKLILSIESWSSQPKSSKEDSLTRNINRPHKRW